MTRYASLFLLTLACSADTPGGMGDDGDIDADTDADTDADSDTDTDTDGDTDDDFDVDEEETDEPVDEGDGDCDSETPVTLYVSPDDSNSMSSPVQARAAAAGWRDIERVAIRTYEFFNYYSFAYEPAPAGAIAVDVQLLATDTEGQWALQVGLASERRTRETRDPMNLTFVVDTSCSMTGEPMQMQKATGLAIADELKEGDIVSMVEWSNDTSVVLEGHAVTGAGDATLRGAFLDLEPGGGTDLNAGLTRGYALAEANWSEGRINRVVLISDGGANLGETSADLIGSKAMTHDGLGTYLVGVGVGTADTYNDQLMDRVTDLGRGAAVFVPTEAEAERVFGGATFLSTLDVAARDVAIQLDLPPGFSIVRTSAEEVSTDPTEIEPQHLAPNDTMVFYQVIEGCDPEIVDDDSVIGVTVTWLDPLTLDEREVAYTTTFGELLAADTALLEKGAAIFAYAEGLKKVRGAPNFDERAAAIDEALKRVQWGLDANPDDADLLEAHAVLTSL